MIDLPFNLGIGAAVQTGFQYAAAHRYTAALQIDADYQHPAEEGPPVVKDLGRAKSGPGDRFPFHRTYRLPGFLAAPSGQSYFSRGQCLNRGTADRRQHLRIPGLFGTRHRTSWPKLIWGNIRNRSRSVTWSQRLLDRGDTGPDAQPIRRDFFHHPLEKYLLHGSGLDLHPFLQKTAAEVSHEFCSIENQHLPFVRILVFLDLFPDPAEKADGGIFFFVDLHRRRIFRVCRFSIP